MTYKEKFSNIVRSKIQVVGDVEEDLKEFFSRDYIIKFLDGEGVIGYTEEEKCIVWWYLYDDNKHSNRKVIVRLAKSFNKPIVYSGAKNHYSNNSVETSDGEFQLVIK